LAKNLKKGNFYATEISSPAIKIARQNAKFHKVNINFLKGNLLEPITKIKNSDFILRTSIIVANLPYLDKNEIKNPTLKFEPRLALYGGPDGLKYFREFFNQIQKYKLQPLAIFLEIGHNQATKIKKIAHLALPKYNIKVKKDLCGFDRLVIITN
jgi:release factor glutamine methyltransferase